MLFLYLGGAIIFIGDYEKVDRVALACFAFENESVFLSDLFAPRDTKCNGVTVPFRTPHPQKEY